MAQQGKALAAKTDDLTSVPRAPVLGGESPDLPLRTVAHIPIHTHAIIHNK